MAELFDIFLACAPKDFRKLPFVISSIDKNIKGFDNLFICSPIDVPPEITSKFSLMYYCYLDENVLPVTSRNLWKFRPNWCFQQHLKIFQKVTKDWYLTIDSDIIINRPMSFFENDRPIWYRGMDQYYQPYFNFMKQMMGLERVASKSYIADMNFFNRKLINDMLLRGGFTVESFLKKSQEITKRDCHIGEPELYGNFCKKYHPDFYCEKDLAQAPFAGRFQDNVNDNVYTEDDIKNAINNYRGQPYDVFSLHSWLNEGDQKR